jgi:hypothetical protein
MISSVGAHPDLNGPDTSVKKKGRGHAQQTFSVALCFVDRRNKQCRFWATCPRRWCRRKAYAVDSGSYFWLHSKHRFWKQQCGRIGWNSNRAHKSRPIRSSIRHEPLRDGCRPVRVTDIRQTIPGLRLRSIDATAAAWRLGSPAAIGWILAGSIGGWCISVAPHLLYSLVSSEHDSAAADVRCLAAVANLFSRRHRDNALAIPTRPVGGKQIASF